MKLIILHDEDGSIDIYSFSLVDTDIDSVENYINSDLGINSNHVTWTLVDDVSITIH